MTDPTKEIEARVSRWCEHDLRFAITPADREAIAATRTARTLILERALTLGPTQELFAAAAVLGRLLAKLGASPTLIAATLDGAEGLLPERVMPARAALMEGYFAAQSDVLLQRSARTWEYPACVVKLQDRSVAIAASYPDEDVDAMNEWAAATARALARDGFRVALVSGKTRARDALSDALAVVGIEVRTSLPAPPPPWWPFRRKV